MGTDMTNACVLSMEHSTGGKQLRNEFVLLLLSASADAVSVGAVLGSSGVNSWHGFASSCNTPPLQHAVHGMTPQCEATCESLPPAPYSHACIPLITHAQCSHSSMHKLCDGPHSQRVIHQQEGLQRLVGSATTVAH